MDPEYGARMELADGTYKTIYAAAKAHQVKENAELEKAVKKKADDTARTLRINQEIENRVFDCPLTSYKRKDDLVTLASALSLPMDGTIAKLTKAIKDHVTKHPARANESRFTGLFGTWRRGTTTAIANPSSVELIAPVLPQSQVSTSTDHQGFSTSGNK